jgi:hypothetical protein
MPKAAGDAQIDVRVDVTEFRRLFGRSSQVDKKLKTALRKNIRLAAERVADDARREVDSGGASATGLRMGIAAGIKVKVMTGSRAGVTIIASSAQMPDGKQSLVRAWEARKGWRHPVFGNTAAWVTQQGHPFFRDPIYIRRNDIRTAVEAAMVEAVASLKG